LSGFLGPFAVFLGDNWENIPGSWEIESLAFWEHSVFVDLSSAEFDRSVKPFVDVVVIPWEIDEFVSSKFVNRLKS
jgi:hypothetical protein